MSQAHNSTGIALGRIRDAAIAASQRACQAESRRSKGQVRARALPADCAADRGLARPGTTLAEFKRRARGEGLRHA